MTQARQTLARGVVTGCKEVLQRFFATPTVVVVTDPEPRERTVKRLDPRALKALAHPLRVRILGSLRRIGPATATVLADRLGESSGLTSYHLRVLAAHDFVVEDTEQGIGRERWWRAAQDMTSWRPRDFAGDPDSEAAEQFLAGMAARSSMAALDRWLDERPTADPDWVDAAELSDYNLRVTPGQLRSLEDEINALIKTRLDAGELTSDEPGTRQIRLLLYAFPDAGERADDRGET
jgi:DNA-binding transcriptional ArsR family regulator